MAKAKVNYMRVPTPDDHTIWQLNYRRAVQSSEALKRLYVARQKGRSYTQGPTIASDALWEGYYELKRMADRIVDDAKGYGRLLMCFYVD